MDKAVQKSALFKVRVYVTGFSGFMYSGKLVKTLVLSRLPDLQSHFQPSSSNTPKLVHVSPLLREINGRVKAVYTGHTCRRIELAKCINGPFKPIVLDGVYSFYFGFLNSVADPSKVLEALIGLNGELEFMNQRIRVQVERVGFINPHLEASRILGEVIKQGGLKVVFASPTMLRDPFRGGRFKTFIPTPINVFSTPVFLYLAQRELYKVGRFIKLLRFIHRVFNETYSTLKTVRLTWFNYGKRPEPGIIGYVKYVVNKDYYEEYNKRINLNQLLEDLLALLIALGTGTGRASGLGHVFLEPSTLGLKSVMENKVDEERMNTVRG
jgi:CRISPR/Cas system endoribonuclease Cas6 (RAMP superfamily)